MSWNVSFVAKDPQVAAATVAEATGVAQYAPPEVRLAISAALKSMPEQAGSAIVVTSEGHLDPSGRGAHRRTAGAGPCRARQGPTPPRPPSPGQGKRSGASLISWTACDRLSPMVVV